MTRIDNNQGSGPAVQNQDAQNASSQSKAVSEATREQFKSALGGHAKPDGGKEKQISKSSDQGVVGSRGAGEHERAAERNMAQTEKHPSAKTLDSREQALTKETQASVKLQTQQGVGTEKHGSAKTDLDTSQNNPGASILQGMSNIPSNNLSHTPSVTASHQAAPTSTSLQELVQDVAERILVSKGENGEKGEVRIQLKNGMLQNTEVRVQVVDGRTQISFVSDNVDSLNMLHQRANDLQNGLKHRLGADVQVNVMSTQDRQRDDQDGRSRNQRSYVTEDTEDEG